MDKLKINKKKYENAILYLCQQLGGSISGKKKLAKLLYYVDFDHFEYNESMAPITGDIYQKWEMGPVPKRYMDIVNGLEKAKKLIRSQKANANIRPTEIFTATAAPDTSIFSKDELYILDRVIEKYGHLNGKQLEILTHQEAPFIAAENNDDIPYELAFYRGTDFNELATA